MRFSRLTPEQQERVLEIAGELKDKLGPSISDKNLLQGALAKFQMEQAAQRRLQKKALATSA